MVAHTQPLGLQFQGIWCPLQVPPQAPGTCGQNNQGEQMAQVSILATEPNDLSLSPMIYMTEGEGSFPQVVL